jgi:hypothetical protein
MNSSYNLQILSLSSAYGITIIIQPNKALTVGITKMERHFNSDMSTMVHIKDKQVPFAIDQPYTELLPFR